MGYFFFIFYDHKDLVQFSSILKSQKKLALTIMSSSELEVPVQCRFLDVSIVSDINLTLRITRKALKSRYHLRLAKHFLIHIVSNV